MAIEFLGLVTDLITIDDLKKVTGVSTINNGGVNRVSGNVRFNKFIIDGVETLISENVIVSNVSWDGLNSINCIFGKIITINNKQYRCRSLTGSDGDNSKTDTSEWKNIIVKYKDNFVWNQYYTMCQETKYDLVTSCIIRGMSNVDNVGGNTKASPNNSVGWRPVLELLEDIKINNVPSDIGDITSFNSFKYKIDYISNFKLTEKLNGEVIRELNNQSSAEFTFEIPNFDSIRYGNHTIEIIADDPNYEGSVCVTSKFNKIKNSIKHVALNSNLKQVVDCNLELNKEIDYQKRRLYEKFNGLEYEVNENESLSKLIDKVQIDVRPGFPLWYRPTDVWLEANASMNIGTGASVIGVDGRIYCIGHDDGTGKFVGVSVYDSKTNTYTSKTSRQTNIRSTKLVFCENKIYSIGGCYINTTEWSKWTSDSINECYDIVTDTWVTKTKMITDRYKMAACAVGNKIYCIGGSHKEYNKGDLYVTNNECYDIVTDIWSTLASMPEKKSNMYHNVYNNKIYCIGGIIQDGDYSAWVSSVTSNLCYDTTNNTWETKKNKPSTSWNDTLSPIIKGRYMYCICGQWQSHSNGGSYDNTKNEVYDLETDDWIIKNPLTKYIGSVVAVNDKTMFSLGYPKLYFYVV